MSSGDRILSSVALTKHYKKPLFPKLYEAHGKIWGCYIHSIPEPAFTNKIWYILGFTGKSQDLPKMEPSLRLDR